jgi:glycerol-3-phosphate acyltransferase PlsY
MATSVFILLAYLIGSLSFAVIVSRAFGLPDPHTYGSGNPGATNVLRTGRKAAAALTLLGDGAKGWVAVFLAQQLGPEYALDASGIAGVALAVFIGHLYPLYFGFRGGKGVATALGVLLAINPWLGLGTLATWLVIALFFRISSLAAIIAAVFAPLYDLWLSGPRLMTVAVAVISVLLLLRHKANILRLVRGEEGRI